MALNLKLRARPGLALLLGALFMAACTPSQSTQPKQGADFAVRVPQKRAGLDTVVVFMPLDARVEPVWNSLRDELSVELNVIPVPISAESTVEDFARAFSEHTPKCVVLFDNKTTALYARYQAGAPSQSFPPAVILLTSYASMYNKVKNSTGIAYEVPLVISATRLRSYIAKPVDRIGVIHRKVFKKYVTDQSALAKIEEINVVRYEVPNDATPREIDEAIIDLANRVDALWILNDNAIMTPDHMRNGWLPAIAKTMLPTIVGIPGLVTRKVQFGTFAVVPDLGALGVQSATLIYDLADNDWTIAQGQRMEEPLSVQTVLHVDLARQHYQFNEEMLGEISEVAK